MKAQKIFDELEKYQKDLFNSWVDSAEFAKVGKKTTVCLLTTDSGFEIVGTSACLDVKNFDATLGKKYALEDALLKLDQQVAFYSQQMGESSNIKVGQ